VALLHKDEGTQYGVTFPDLPGCFASGDTPDDAYDNAIGALRVHIESMEGAGIHAPTTRSFDQILTDPQLKDAVKRASLMLVPLALPSGHNKRINISIDERLLHTIDEFASRRGQHRSAFLADAAKQVINQELQQNNPRPDFIDPRRVRTRRSQRNFPVENSS